MPRHFPILFVALATFSSALPALGQVKTVKFEDAKKWEALASAAISDDGRWFAYRLNLVDGDGRLVVRNVDSPERKEVVGAGAAVFSDDSKWAAYLISPPEAVAERLRAERKPIRTKLGILELASGQERIIDDVQRFRFTKGGRFLLAHRYRPETRKEGGSDLTIMDLLNVTPLTFGNVVEAESNDAGDLLALQMEPEIGEKSIALVDLPSGRLKTLFWGLQEVGDMAWSAKADAFAYLIGDKDERRTGSYYRVYFARNVREEKVNQYSFDPRTMTTMPKDYRITEYGLQVNDEGSVVMLGVAPWAELAKPKQKPEDRPGVEIWHTKDVDTIPEQRVRYEADRRKVALAVWRPASGSLQVIGDGSKQNVGVLMDGRYALVRDPIPYRTAATNGITYYDYRIADTATGTVKIVLTKLAGPVYSSRKGGFLCYFDAGNWYLYSLADDSKKNLTAGLKTSFYDGDYDGTSPVRPPANLPDWLADDSGVILYDDYDAWLYQPGADRPRRLTEGRAEELSFDLAPISEDQLRDGVRADGTLHFSVRSRDDYSTGYYATTVKGEGKMLTYDKALLGSLRRAEKADRAIFTLQSFAKSPDYYVTNLAFSQAKPLTRTNPFQSEFAWPKVEMISYKSRFGKELKGLLIYPADYRENRRYPMVTYIYERLSDRLHNYIGPNPWNPYNAQMLAQEGYFVFMPDITYLPRNPGKSAVDCLEPALEAVFKKRVGVDADRVGLIGHSWGGYQTAYVTTVSKMFRVGVAGAPLTELTSMYNSFYWNSGVSDQVLFEISQGRMEVPFWEDPEAYFANSPVWQSKKRTSPLLIMTGDKDGAVDYNQSLYLYQTLRRMGKEAVLLVYAGENHNPTRRPNQLDYATRLRHYLDVYLKGLKPEPWVQEGVPLTIQRQD
jgi:dipeptidyl aminopeptidase/acylaminoacyl peptidase